jgi:hypothetical protein
VNGERLSVAGQCIVCRKQTESVVQFDADAPAFLCPPCGKGLREEETSLKALQALADAETIAEWQKQGWLDGVCLCGAGMKDGKCSVEGCVCSE